MLVEVIRSFSNICTHDGGVRVRRYTPGTQVLDDEVAATAIKEGWARQKREAKMKPGSPENKMATVESTKEPRSTLSLRRPKNP